jgi:hypothetical protein
MATVDGGRTWRGGASPVVEVAACEGRGRRRVSAVLKAAAESIRLARASRRRRRRRAARRGRPRGWRSIGLSYTFAHTPLICRDVSVRLTRVAGSILCPPSILNRDLVTAMDRPRQTRIRSHCAMMLTAYAPFSGRSPTSVARISPTTKSRRRLYATLSHLRP